jgi:TolB-like protein/Tfp pilus assembly protein PilF
VADVFISYKAEDRARVAPLVKAVEAEGLSVWWDAHISAGDEWRETIQRELDAAKCVIVVWSQRSVAREGRFVRDEATRAERRGVLLPVRIDPVEPPLGFGETQALDLAGWNGRRDDPRFAAIVAAVKAVIRREPHEGGSIIPIASRGIDRRLLLAGGGAAVLLTGAGAWWALGGGQAATKGLAVLPFRNLSGDPAQDYFGEGIAEELRSALSRLPGLQVIARISSEAVSGLDAEAAAAELGVENILSGSIRHSPSIVRVNAQLVNGGTGADAWSATYDRPAGDALSIQSEIAAEVAGALDSQLSGRAAVAPAGTSNSAAHDLVLQANEIDGKEDGQESVRRVLALAEAALALDPKYAAAKATQASALSNLAIFYTLDDGERQAALQRAMAIAREAIALDPRLPKGYRTLAYLQKTQLDYRGALKNYRQANAIGTDGGSLIGYAFFLAEMGRFDEATVIARKAAKVDPLNPDAYAALADVDYFAGRHDSAIKWLRRMMEMAPDRFYARYFLALSLSALRRYDEALAELQGMPEDNAFRQAAEAVVSARAGDRAASDRALAKIGPEEVPMLRAGIHAQRGEGEQSIALIEQLVADRNPDVAALRSDPFFDPIRGDPRVRALVTKLDFP